MDAHEYEKKIQDLLETIDILQSRLKETDDQRHLVLQRLRDSEEEKDKIREHLNHQGSDFRSTREELSKSQGKVSNLLGTNLNLNEKCKTKFEILNRELEDKDQQLNNLVKQVKSKDEAIIYYSVNNEQTLRSNNNYRDLSEELQQKNKQLEQKIRELENSITRLSLNKRSEATLLLEIEHMKDDNIRLIQLLKSTEKYEDFAYLAENLSGGIRFIKAIDKRQKSLNKLSENSQSIKQDPMNGDDWISRDVYTFTQDFNNRNNLELSESLINDLLGNLNKIWRESHNKQLSRLKAKYQKEIMDLKRSMSMKAPLDEHTTSTTITKLKKDLKDTRDDLRNNIVYKNKINS